MILSCPIVKQSTTLGAAIVGADLYDLAGLMIDMDNGSTGQGYLNRPLFRKSFLRHGRDIARAVAGSR
ncbi:hypothetical protein OAJ57_00250 [Alphaproteobacteria bacterium]|nr:hypothetical protein [Alphaproteobacteria bacterium]